MQFLPIPTIYMHGAALGVFFSDSDIDKNFTIPGMPHLPSPYPQGGRSSPVLWNIHMRIC